MFLLSSSPHRIFDATVYVHGFSIVGWVQQIFKSEHLFNLKDEAVTSGH